MVVEDQRHVRRAVGTPLDAGDPAAIGSAVRPHVHRDRPEVQLVAANPRGAVRLAPPGQHHPGGHARGEAVPLREEPGDLGVRGRLQPDQHKPGAEHRLELGRVVPAADHNRAAAAVPVRRQTGLVIS